MWWPILLKNVTCLDICFDKLLLPVLEAYSRLNIVVFYNNNNKVQLANSIVVGFNVPIDTL